jgi:UDP-N-acetylmuramoyl-tripeptide--D-alanyl-D-alanine ligase
MLPADRIIVLVDDTLRALQDVAHFVRKGRDIPLVAVTGSNGKTTTKEMVHAVLSKKFRTLKNAGNLNNHIGLPLSLAGLELHDECAVLEMGMNAAGEIRRLCDIAQPSHGIITNIGTAHIGRLGSREALREAKLELLKDLATAIVNADDEYLMEGLGTTPFHGDIITFGIKSNADVRAEDITRTDRGSDFILSIRKQETVKISLNVFGLFNVCNALAAAAAGIALGVSKEQIKEALQEFRAVSMRFEVTREKGITLINDAYNANPASMEEALRELVRLGGTGRTVAVLGEMRELAEHSESAHRAVGEMIAASGVDVFIAVGERMAAAAEEATHSGGKKGRPVIHTFKNAEKAAEGICSICRAGDTVLLKGSRAVAMEKVAGRLRDAV